MYHSCDKLDFETAKQYFGQCDEFNQWVNFSEKIGVFKQFYGEEVGSKEYCEEQCKYIVDQLLKGV